MDQPDCLKFDLNLQRLSTLTIAELIWDSPTSKKEIENYAVNIYDNSNTSVGPVENEKKWRDLTRKILVQVDCLKLPPRIIPEIKKITILTGEKIFIWFLHMITDAQIHHRYVQKFYWTPHGILDQLKIFRDWAKDPRFPDSPEHDRNITLFTFGSTFGDLRILHNNLKDVAQVINDYVGFKIPDISKFNAESALGPLLLYVIANGDFEQLDMMYSNLSDSAYPGGIDQMFLHCVKHGFEKSAEWYYGGLKPKDKRKLAYQAALDCVQAGVDAKIHHVSERSPEVLIYLLGKLSNKQKREFLVENINNVHSFFLNIWPYKELIIPILDSIWDELTFVEHFSLLDKTIFVLKDFAKNRWDIYKELHQPILRYLLMKVPKSTKLHFFLNRKEEFVEFFKRNDFLTINTIVNDEDLKQHRFKLINISNSMIKYLSDGGTTQHIDDYMKQLKFSEEEQKNFLKFSLNPKLLAGLLTSGCISEVDTLLKWQSEDVIKIKKEMRKHFDPVKMCSKLISNGKYNLILEYIKYLYEDDLEEFEKIKSQIFNVRFIRTEFCRIWLRNRKWKVIRKEANKLLQYFLKMDEVITWFKKEKLMNDENFIKFFCELYEDDKKPSQALFDEAFKFCGTTDDKIKEIKRKILNNVDWWLDRYSLANNKFLIMNAIINWACTEDQKKRIIEKHMNSSKGALLFSEYTRRCFTQNIADDVKNVLISEWLEPHGNGDKMKKEMKKLNGNTESDDSDEDITQFAFGGLMDLLSLMKNRK